MRTLLTLVAWGFGVSLTGLSAQTDLTGGFTFDGQARDYRLHLPPDTAGFGRLPLVLNLHGYTSFAAQQEGYSRMNEVADTAGFAVCYPNGLNREWNVGWVFNRPTDDVGFLLALVDTLVANYGFDADRIYACGMSNGGFMSYRLACEASGTFAAIGSVTGGMVPGLRGRCEDTERVVPVMQIHGTDDPTVPFRGGLINDPIDTTVAFWARRHGVTGNLESSDIPDRADDGFTTRRYRYLSDDGDVSLVEYYVVDDGLHTWPGGAGNLRGQTQDFSASAALWRFFEQHSLATVSEAVEAGFRQNLLRVWPNPLVGRELHVSPSDERRVFLLTDAVGRELLRETIPPGQTRVALPVLPKGVYLVREEGCDACLPARFVKD